MIFAILVCIGMILAVFAIPTAVVYPEFYGWAYKALRGQKTGTYLYGYPHKMVKPLSHKAKSVLRAHQALPPEHRLDVDMLNVLNAYDIKNGGKEKVDSHFNYHHYCYRECSMPDYAILQDSIRDINDALVQQREAIAAAGVAGLSNNMPLLIERAREEASIIRSTTKELT